MNILVVGDTIVDRNIICSPTKKDNPDYPNVLRVKNIIDTSTGGGALNVACNVMAMGVNCIYHGYVNKTIIRHLPIDLIPKTTLGSYSNKDHHTKLLQITRYIDQQSRKHILRVDQAHDYPLIEQPPQWALDQTQAVIISDYNHGTISPKWLETFRKTWKGPLYLDSKRPNAFNTACTILKLNEFEHAELSKGKRLLYRYMITTLGTRGVRWENYTKFPGLEKKVIDSTGAGDTFMAALAVARYKKLDMSSSIQFANYAAGISVTKPGVSTVTLDEIMEEYIQYDG